MVVALTNPIRPSSSAFDGKGEAYCLRASIKERNIENISLYYLQSLFIRKIEHRLEFEGRFGRQSEARLRKHRKCFDMFLVQFYHGTLSAPVSADVRY